MFANTQMGGLAQSIMSPLRTMGQMARRTTDRSALLVLQAGLEAMLTESKNANAFIHDQATAELDLAYLRSKTGRNRI